MAAICGFIPFFVPFNSRQVLLLILALGHKLPINAFPNLLKSAFGDASLGSKYQPCAGRALKEIETLNRRSFVFGTAHIIVVAILIKTKAQSKVAGMPADFFAIVLPSDPLLRCSMFRRLVVLSCGCQGQ